MPKILIVFGTRPEAIKLAPAIKELRSRSEHFHVQVCITAQHRELLDQVLDVFSIEPEFDLDLMHAGQTLFQSASRVVAGLESVLCQVRPDMVLVQGDTTTTMCSALAAFYAHVAVGHVEAGLRTGTPDIPFPKR